MCLTFIFYQKVFYDKRGIKAFLFSCDDLFYEQFIQINRNSDVYIRPEMNSNRFEISLRGKFSLRYKVNLLLAFT